MMNKRIIQLFPILLIAFIVTGFGIYLSGCGTGTVEKKIVEKTFSNGFRLILNENHASPMITSIVMVEAGSKFENDQTNGFTHLLEHLNFDGTATKSRIEINEGIKNHGGYINAFTRKDATTYMILMPSEFIEYGLDVQSDQLFGSIFPEDEFEKERKVVTEEIWMNYDNIGYQADIFTDSVFYAGTPYERTVLGSPKTIEEVSRQAVVDYYKSQYTPDKMLGIAIGDFDPDSMIALYETYFGERERGDAGMQVDVKYEFPAQDSVHYKTAETRVTYLNIAFPAPQHEDADYYAFDMMVNYLGDEETSPLYRELKGGEEPLVQSVSIYLDTKKEFTNLIVSVMTDDPARIDEIINRIKAVLQRMGQSEIDPEELQRFIVKAKVDEYLLEERLHYWGIMKSALLAAGGYDFVAGYVNNLSSVTPEAIKNAAGKYYSDIHYIAAAVVPENVG
ncbi:MAG: hypothetical protein GF307_02715 [candidate division Zixibacteria bacterium]|nr:hypothetical protein [candidate division Zixibacteria bacterium]